MSRKHKKQSLGKIEQLTDEQVLDVSQECLSTTIEVNTVNELETQDMPESTTPPTCPFPGDPSMGDKDPEVMAWYRDNAPEEYARRYANRVTPSDQTPLYERTQRGPISDFEDEADEVRKPKVIM